MNYIKGDAPKDEKQEILEIQIDEDLDGFVMDTVDHNTRVNNI